MSKSLNSQNLALLQALHAENSFLKRLKYEWLEELSQKAHFFVFSSGTVLAQEKEDIDYLGITLEGRVVIAGAAEKEGPGFLIGTLGYFGILPKHAHSIIGDSDGIVLALRLEQLGNLSDSLSKELTDFVLEKSITKLAKRESFQAAQSQEIQEKKISHLYLPAFRQLLNEQIQPKQKACILKYFPFRMFKMKDLIVNKFSEPTLLIVIKGELIAKDEAPNSSITIRPGNYYNSDGFLLNYSPRANVYCLTEEAIVLSLPKSQFLRHVQSSTFVKLANFLLRNEINVNGYEVESYEKRKEKETISSQPNAKWSIFQKDYYEIIPLNISAKADPKKQARGSKGHRATKSSFMGVLFQEQLAQKSNIKTNASNNSKMSKMISLKTEKNEQNDMASAEKQINALQKEVESLTSKIKYFQENFVKAKLNAIHYQSKLGMEAVFKQIKELGDRHKGQKSGEGANVTTLKDAFEKQMKQNRIKEVVARCAYRWLWAVRRKKGMKNLRSSFNTF